MAVPKYCVNKATKKFHLRGGCGFSENKNCVPFFSYDEAKERYGSDLSICKYCKSKHGSELNFE